MIKRTVTVVLLNIKKVFRVMGIDISFVKKEQKIDPVDRNKVDSMDEIYASKNYQNAVLSKEHQFFFHQIIELIEKKNIPIDDKLIADFGCGVGNLLFHINSKYQPKQSCGFDFSTEALELAKKRFPSGEFHKHDIYEKTDNQFDLVFCTETLEHLLYPDKALDNLIYSLKPGGYLIITVPDGRKDNFVGHINFWSIESWNVFIERNRALNNSETGYINENIIYAIINQGHKSN